MVITMSSTNKLAVVLVRGTVNMAPDVRKTLDLLRLRQKHACVVIDDTPMNRGMLQKVKDYVTYGPVKEETVAEVFKQRGEKSGTVDQVDVASLIKEFFQGSIKLKDFEPKGMKPFVRLHPPRGGFERGGIKETYTNGGVLGERKDGMDSLLTKMS